MTTIDLSPLYRNSVGFDRMAHLLNSALGADTAGHSYPPYNIEVTGENAYSITLAMAGFTEEDLDLQVERNVLTIRGKQTRDDTEVTPQFLHKGIANRSFERKFNLADHVEVVEAELAHGILTVKLVREIPEAMKPRKINIGSGAKTPKLEVQSADKAA